MKLNLISIIRPVTTSIVGLFLISGIHNFAMADNAAALKDSIKTNNKLAEVKTTDMKDVDAAAKAPADDDFKKLDANKDGKISLKEAVKDKSLAGQFDATDINHDGMVSTEEYTSFKAASAVKSIEPAPAATTN